MFSRLTHQEKFAYIHSNVFAYWIKFFAGFIAAITVITSITLLLLESMLLLILFLPPLLVAIMMFATTYYISMRYTPFHIGHHNAKVLAYKEHRPTVDILLPVAGEDWKTLKRTWNHVRDLRYKNFSVLVLDDKGDPFLQSQARIYGFRYYSRPNKGECKKAGNLRFGLTKSSAEYFVILDADFAPNPEFIQHLLPYFSDPSVAIVQSPQYFQLTNPYRTQNKLQYDAGVVQEEFYAYIQVARDSVNATVCVGSNAIYSRKHLDEVGGIAQIDHSEDIMTGISLQEKGYSVKYVPMNLASGECPDDLQSYFSQQQRWCRGNLDLVQDKAFWKKKLNLSQRVAYLNGYFYYLFTVFEKVLWTVPFVLIFFFDHLIDIASVLWIAPSLVYLLFFSQITRKYKRRFFSIKEISNGFIYAWTWISSLVSKEFKWIASGHQRNTIKPDYRAFLIFMSIFCISWTTASIAALLVSFSRIYTVEQALDYAPVLLSIIVYTCLIISVTVKHLRYPLNNRKKEFKKNATLTASIN